jgi:hypothetical protein
MNRKPTYAELFAFLEGLGFEAISGKGELAYVHRPTDTLLLFSPADRTSAVADADLASVQMRLERNGLINQPLLSLLGAEVEQEIAGR